jgi:outer membrane protease
MKPAGPFREKVPIRYLRPRQDAKGKTAFSSDSKLMLYSDWNESKKARE